MSSVWVAHRTDVDGLIAGVYDSLSTAIQMTTSQFPAPPHRVNWTQLDDQLIGDFYEPVLGLHPKRVVCWWFEEHSVESLAADRNA